MASLGPMTEEGEQDYEVASAHFRQLADEIGMEHGPDWEFHELLDLVAYSGTMDGEQRERAYTAFSLAGYGSIGLEVVARLLRDLPLDHAVAAGAVDSRDIRRR